MLEMDKYELSVVCLSGMFLWKIFCCKIISSETVWMKKNFWSKLFLLQNHYFGNSLDEIKFLVEHFLDEFFFVAK